MMALRSLPLPITKKLEVGGKRKCQEGDIPEETKRSIVMPVLPDEAKKVFEFADLSRHTPSKELLHWVSESMKHPEAIENPPSKKVKVPEFSGIENRIKASKEAEKANPEISQAEEDKENAAPPTTPSSKSKNTFGLSRHKKTPGRDGPIKIEQDCPSPDIKPFKGPPGKKVRKTQCGERSRIHSAHT
jgi:hypothetical protein